MEPELWERAKVLVFPHRPLHVTASVFSDVEVVQAQKLPKEVSLTGRAQFPGDNF
jgi:hypothetical protein